MKKTNLGIDQPNRRQLELAFGKINRKRGRLPKQKENGK